MVAVGYTVVPLRSDEKVSANRAALNAHETHASASMLGQFRTSISSWLWLRTDLYLHNGVEMRQLTESERKRGKSGVGGDEHGPDGLHDDSTIVTVVPSKEHDFRGWIGDVERAKSAYKDMTNHGHNDPKDSLPLFRLMTWIDPSFEPGWVTGATIIAREKSDSSFDKAVNFLQEGLKHNAKSVSLNAELGRFYASRKKDFRKALDYLHVAMDTYAKATNKNPEDDTDALWAYRWGALSYRELNQGDFRQRVAYQGLQFFKDDPVLSRLYMEPPFILSMERVEEWRNQAINEALGKSDTSHDSHDHEDHDHNHDHHDH